MLNKTELDMMEKGITIIKNKYRKASVDNELQKAAHGLDLLSKRLVLLALSKLDSRKPVSRVFRKSDFTVEIYAKDYAELCNLDMNKAYEQMKKASKKILKSTIQKTEINNKGIEFTREFVWAQECQYYKRCGKVILIFSEPVSPYISMLHKNFTSYSIDYVAKLKSYYSIRFFEMMMQYKDTGWFLISVEDFCFRMNAPKGYIDKFQRIKERILNQIKKDLTYKEGWIITWETLKKGKGKRITNIKFSFKKNPQLDLLGDEK